MFAGHLNPLYTYLPYCAHIEEEKDPNNPKERVRVVHLLKTYPPYPWLPDTGDHSEEDPVRFIEMCAAEGLVHWETAEQKAERLRRDGYIEGQKMSYSDFLKDQELINTMESMGGWEDEYA